MRLWETIREDSVKTGKQVDKILVMMIAIILAGLCMIGVVYAAPGGDDTSGSNSFVNKNSAGVDINITAFSGMLADSFNDIMTDVNTNYDMRIMLLEKMDDTSKNNRRLSNIGNVIGLASNVAIDDSDNNSIFAGGVDAASRRLTLGKIEGLYGYDAEKLGNSALAQYIVFGSALNYLGIDEFRDASGNADGMRMVIGYATYIVFILAYSASGILGFVVEIMDRINVFGWLHNALMSNSTNLADDLTNGVAINGNNMVLNDTGNGVQSIIRQGSLMNDIKSVYQNLVQYRWVVLGLMLVLFVGSITVFKSKQMGAQATNQTRLRNLGLRVVIACIGLPLVGMVFSTTLGLVRDGFTDTKYIITDFIYTEFLDYEDWLVTEPGKAFEGLDGLTVVYDTSSQSMKITSTSANAGSADAFGDAGIGGAGNNNPSTLNASQLVYMINQKMYNFLPDEYTNVGHTSESYMSEMMSNETGVRPKDVYGTIIDRSKADNGNRTALTEEQQQAAYAKARDLILGYARGNTVVADALDSRYQTAFNWAVKDIIDALALSNANIREDLKDPDDPNNTTIAILIERIFNNSAASSRLWAHYYVKADEYREEEAAAYGDLIVEVSGIPIFPEFNTGSGGRGNSYLTVSDREMGGGQAFMKHILNAATMDDNDLPGVGAYFTPVEANALKVSAASDENGNQLPRVSESDTSTASKRYFTYAFKYDGEGMSTMALYNYLHSKFSLGTVDIYTPDQTTNSGVSTMHYSISTPYSGVPEVIQLVYTVVLLFSIGIIGWVFGMSLMLNVIMTMFKAVPAIFKMAIGSIQGFVEALLTVLSIVAELFVTLLLYTYSVKIIDFILAVMDFIIKKIMDAFFKVDGETLSIISNLASMVFILWGVFELIRWRQAITISIKSMLTHVLNQAFGTSAAMPTGASNGMLKAAAIGGAAAMTAGALADQGTLDDVINDMTQSDLGSDLSEKLKEGDYDGAWNDIKDYANGDYDVRGGSSADKLAKERGLEPMYNENGNRVKNENGENMYKDSEGNQYAASEIGEMPNGYQELTEDQQAELDRLDDDIEAARAAGDEDRVKELEMERAERAAKYRTGNYKKAMEAGVADYATYEKTLADSEKAQESAGYKPDSVDAVTTIPEEPSKELEPEAKAAYVATRKGDAAALRTAAETYNGQGLTADQAAEIDQMVLNGASETDIATAIDGFAQQNFGDDYQAVVAKMNEAAGRSGNVTYGSNDNSDGNARTVHVASAGGDGAMAYNVTDNNANAGTQTIAVMESGDGATNYVNTTAGGGMQNTIQTMDMGSANTPADAISYAGMYNSMAAMVRTSGGEVQGGKGGTTVVTVTEMAAKASQMQMADNNIEVNRLSYGDSGNATIGNAMVTTQIEAIGQAAASGQTIDMPAYTPISVSSAVGQATGVTTYDVVNVEGGNGNQVALQATGGAEGGQSEIRINYSGNPNNGGINAAPNGELNMIDKATDFAKFLYAVDTVRDIITGDGGDKA